MRALITGISGFVGSHLAEYLLAHTDWKIFGMMRWNDSLENLSGLVKQINQGNRVTLAYADLNDSFAVRGVVRSSKPDYVFHLAAQSFPTTSFTGPSETLQTNIIGTLNLLEAIRHEAKDAWVHVCASSEVYGRVEPTEVPIKETCRFHPASPYAISKIGTDMLGRFYAEAYGLKTVVTRMFTHTGPRRGDVFAESSFAKQIAMIEAGQLNPPIKVGNLHSLRTISDVRDAVRAYHMLLTVNPQVGEVYNIGGNHTATIGKILMELLNIAGLPNLDIEVEPSRLRPIDANLQIPDCSKFMNHTGWKPEIPFQQTMIDLLAYWRERVRKGVQLQR